MPQYNYVQVGLTPETIDELDSMAESDDNEYDSRSAIVRDYVQQGLDQ